MSKPDGVFVFIGTYPSEAAARSDYDILKDLYGAGDVGTYDAAVITKDRHGKVHVNKDETATRHGGWGGLVAGAVVGLLFPPSILVGAVVGGAIGAVGGHVFRGMSREDLKDFGNVIDVGAAALVVVGASTIEAAVKQAGLRPIKQFDKQLDVETKDIDAALDAAAAKLR